MITIDLCGSPFSIDDVDIDDVDVVEIKCQRQMYVFHLSLSYLMFKMHCRKNKWIFVFQKYGIF